GRSRLTSWPRNLVAGHIPPRQGPKDPTSSMLPASELYLGTSDGLLRLKEYRQMSVRRNRGPRLQRRRAGQRGHSIELSLAGRRRDEDEASGGDSLRLHGFDRVCCVE